MIVQTTDDLQLVLARGGFAVKGFAFSVRHPPSDFSNDGVSVKVAGLKWYTKSDKISLETCNLNFSRKIRDKRSSEIDNQIPKDFTRRDCVGKVAEVFDLVGKVTPITCGMKLDLRTLVNRKLDWDDKMPSDLEAICPTNFKTIRELADVPFYRAILPEDAVSLDINTIDTEDAVSLDINIIDTEDAVSLDINTIDTEDAVSLDINTNDTEDAVSLDINTIDTEDAVSLDINTIDTEDAVSLNTNTIDTEDAVSLDINTIDTEDAVSLDINTIDTEDAVSLNTNTIDTEDAVSLDINTIDIGDAVSLDINTIDTGDASKSLVCSATYACFQRKDKSYSCQLIFLDPNWYPKVWRCLGQNYLQQA